MQTCHGIVQEIQDFSSRLTSILELLFQPDPGDGGDRSTLATELQGFLESYDAIQAGIFNGTHVDPEDFAEHGECRGSLERISRVTGPAVEHLFILVKNLTELSTI